MRALIRLSLIALLSCLPIVQCLAQSRGATPFAGAADPGQRYKVNNTFKKTFDLSKIGGVGREETQAIFDKIWIEYRTTHQLTRDGDFVEEAGASFPDSIENKALFYVYVKKNSPSLTLIDKQDCPICRGKGRISVKNDFGFWTEIECSRCDGTGRLANINQYTLVHTGELPQGISKYLPQKPAVSTAPGGQPDDGETMSDQGKLKAAVEKHLSELLSSKLTGKKPSGFGVSGARFSAQNDIHWQLDLEFQNKELIKVTGANVKVTFFEKGYGSKLTIVAYNDVRLRLDANDRASISFTEFTYPELKAGDHRMSKSDAFANYASVLKQLKRANDILITITSVSPVNAQKAIDIDNDSTWRIRRETESTGTSTTKSPADTAPASKSTSFGSGMVFTKDGHIFTNYHVIGKANTISIVTYENGQLTSKLPATVISKDQRTDLAILQCKGWKPAEGAPATPPPVVSSSNCKLGDQVFVLGYPLPGTVSSNVKYTKGDVSDMAGLDDDSSKIQHTAQIQPGNSGGPMALMDGRIIGVIVSSLSEMYAMKTSGALPQGVNFSIKSDYVLTQASIAGIDVPKGQASSEPVAHVKAYTVQIMCEK
jgi:S1-C subfamily serine protease